MFDGVNLVVRDMEAAVAFYRLLGFEVPDTDPEWQAHHRNVRTGGVDFDLDSDTFASKWNQGWPGAATGGMGVLGFRVASRDDVDAVYARMTRAGYRGQQEPYDAFWGARYAIVEDPDGNAVGIMSPSDDGMRSMPETPEA